MVGVVLGLKLRLWRNALRSSASRRALTVVGAVLSLLGVLLATASALTAGSVAATGAMVVTLLSGVTCGWLIMPLIAFGVDDSLDPARLALLPLRAGRLLPGLLLAAACGVPGLATLLLTTGVSLGYRQTPAAMAASVVLAPLGLLTCVLLARVLTTAVARALRGRRFRDAAAVVFAVGTASLGIGVNAVLGRGVTHPDQLDAAFARIGAIAGWTPVGWVWAVPADIAAGAPGRAFVRLALALVLAALLLLAWHRLLGKALTSPSGDTSFGRVRSGGMLNALLPDTAAGAIAGRCLRYWRRDPRYVTTAVTAVVVPLLLLTWQAATGAGSTLILLAPVLLAWLVASALSQDTSFDGSALWLHAVSGVRGTDDRIGRVLAMATWSLPMILVVDAVTLNLVNGWSRAGPVLGLSVAVLLAGVGASSLVSARWQTKAPAAGGNPFAAESGSGLEGVLVVLAHGALTGAAVLPVVGLALFSLRMPWAGLLVAPLGLLVGVIALVAGIRRGGRLLEASWPDVMVRLTR